MSALHRSAYEGDANIVRGRIELGEDPNSRDEVRPLPRNFLREVLQSRLSALIVMYPFLLPSYRVHKYVCRSSPPHIRDAGINQGSYTGSLGVEY